MVRGTTPTFTFTIKNQNVDLTAARNVYVTFQQSNIVIEKTGESLDIGEKTVSVWLTQAESLKLSEGSDCAIQINWTYLDSDGVTCRRAATKVQTIRITRQLLKRVIE